MTTAEAEVHVGCGSRQGREAGGVGESIQWQAGGASEDQPAVVAPSDQQLEPGVAGSGASAASCVLSGPLKEQVRDCPRRHLLPPHTAGAGPANEHRSSNGERGRETRRQEDQQTQQKETGKSCIDYLELGATQKLLHVFL